ncbi:DinB family protein [Pedobacter duraquae]|uniref:DinB family protein n=1 Tax=Pedobacter duraquae TaxID=425511 RepID=A0A4R6IE85_9SPHI|nr:DinB family protein [Pedobacter duraquae]TDO19991.1 DinB family protein [Pedobacter duraquae]
MSHTLEVWQRGPLPDITPLLQPVGHALLQAREELELYLTDFSDELLWVRPAGLASVSFHLQHLSGVLDRVFTYAHGFGLSETQFKQLADEDVVFIVDFNTRNLLERFSAQVDLAMAQLKNTDPETLTEYRGVGRAGLPSTVIGLLVHAAEHTMRHVGQLMVTAAVLKNGGL